MDLTIRTAVCTTDDKKYKLEELQNMSKDNEILKNLACIICGCKLTFYHKTALKREYLKTKNDEKHLPKCSQYFEREERQFMYSTGKVKSGRLDGNALGSRLDRMSRKLLNPVESIPSNRLNTGIKGKKRNKVISANTDRKKVTKVSLTTDPTVQEISNEESKNMRVPQVMANNVRESLVGKTIVLGGFLEKVTINGNDTVSIIVSYKEGSTLIRLRQDVFKGQIGFLDRIKSLKNIRKRFPDDKLAVSAGVDVQRSLDGDVETALSAENALRINGDVLGVFISMY